MAHPWKVEYSVVDQRGREFHHADRLSEAIEIAEINPGSVVVMVTRYLDDRETVWPKEQIDD